MPKVSVIVPSYNHEKYVKDAVDSVLNQTFQDFEIVVRDDGSTDKTLEIIKSYQDPRIRILRSNENLGQFASTNVCLAAAVGEYLCFLNSDDRFKENKLEKQVKYLEERQDMAAVFTRPELIDDDGKLFTNKKHMAFELFYLPHLDRYAKLRFFFTNGNYLCHPSIMIRKKIQDEIGEYDENFAQISDIDYWVRLGLKYDFGMIEEKLTDFRIRKDEENMSGDKPSARMRSFVEWKFILRHYLDLKIEELTKIFPEINKKFDHLDQKLTAFYVAMLALDSPFRSHHQFAADTLYKLLINEKTKAFLKKEHDFTNKDFIKITGSLNLYGYDEKMKVQDDIDKQHLKKILNSWPYRVWKVLKRTKKILNSLYKSER